MKTIETLRNLANHIHMAHLDQIGAAFMRYEPEPEPVEEAVEEAIEEAAAQAVAPEIELTASAFVREAIANVFGRMWAQIEAKNAETGKPILNSKTRAKLRVLRPILEAIDAGRPLTIAEEIAALRCLHVSENMTAKLADVNALSTACSVNPTCQARAKDCRSICAHCFAFLTFERYNDLEQAAIINFIVLNAALYSVEAWAAVNIPPSAAFDLFRIEAFGDVASAIQCANYIRLAETHRYLQRVGVWSKNLGFWASAFEVMDKPTNMIFNASSPVLNKAMVIPDRFAWFVDHVFTVYDAASAVASGVDINCGDRICANCKRCYTADNERAVNEILKQEAKRYYKAIGKEYTGRR